MELLGRLHTNLQNRRLVSAKFLGYKTIENFDFNEIKTQAKAWVPPIYSSANYIT